MKAWWASGRNETRTRCEHVADRIVQSRAPRKRSARAKDKGCESEGSDASKEKEAEENVAMDLRESIEDKSGEWHK